MDQWQREDLRRVHGSVAERGLEKGAWVSGGKLVVNDRGKEWVLVGLVGLHKDQVTNASSQEESKHSMLRELINCTQRLKVTSAR